jgi:hypothetical protein
MKERPILFSAPMVRAILEGRKTQTRRLVKIDIDPKVGRFSEADPSGFWGFPPEHLEPWPTQCIHCPHGIKGDRLWVRETWQFCDYDGPGGEPATCFVYRADGETEDKRRGWIPSTQMPRWASRITLEITGVRVERLQDISNDDCVAEGITAIGKGVRLADGIYAQAGRYENKASTVRQLFSELWTEINGPGSWLFNPWVWVLEFRRVEG